MLRALRRPGTTSEDVDAKGVANIAKAWAARQNGAAAQGPPQRKEMVIMRSSKDLDRWVGSPAPPVVLTVSWTGWPVQVVHVWACCGVS